MEAGNELKIIQLSKDENDYRQLITIALEHSKEVCIMY